MLRKILSVSLFISLFFYSSLYLNIATAAPSTAQLVAHWNFDQSTGITLLDDSGNGRNGTLMGTPTWTTGRINNALGFDGTDYVSIGNVTTINGINKLTLATWMKRTTSGGMVLLGKQTTNQDVAIEAWSDGKIYFQLSKGKDTYGTINLNDTSWHHITLVFDGTLTGNANRLKAYVDGIQQTLTFKGTVPTTTTTNTTPFYIGRTGGSYSNGLIDDTWLYARALTQTEIQELMQASPVPTITATPTPTIAPTETPIPTIIPTDTPTPTVTPTATPTNTPTLTPTVTVTPTPSTIPAGTHYITAVSSNGRYFTDQNGEPVLIKGDSPWAMFSDLSPAQVEQWATNRENYGFNAAIVSLIGDTRNGASSNNGATYDGILPFNNGNITSWNETYWLRMENYLTILKNHGITAFLYPMDGWTTLNGGALYHKSAADSYTYGQMVANRFPTSLFPNIVWMAGGDYQYYDDLAVATEFTNMIAGIRSTGDNRMFSIQLNTETTSTDIGVYEPLVQWNFDYSYTQIYAQVLQGYRRQTSARDPRPSLLGESHYQGEGTGNSNDVLRRQQLWALTSGSPGEFTGSADWLFNTGWENRLDTTWVTQAQKIREFFSSIPNWYLLVPDDQSPLVTQGRGTKLGPGAVDSSQNDYVTAAQTPDKSVSIIYVPTNIGNTNARTITLDTTKLPTSYTATWVDPTNTTMTQTASISVSGQVTTPELHSDGSRDWILYIH